MGALEIVAAVVVVIGVPFTAFAFKMHRWQESIERAREEHEQRRQSRRSREAVERNSYVAGLRFTGSAEVGRKLGEAFAAAMAGQPVERRDFKSAIERFSP